MGTMPLSPEEIENRMIMDMLTLLLEAIRESVEHFEDLLAALVRRGSLTAEEIATAREERTAGRAVDLLLDDTVAAREARHLDMLAQVHERLRQLQTRPGPSL